MATLYITEFQEVAKAGSDNLLMGQCPPVAQQTVTFTTSTQSAAFNAKTRFIRVYSSADAMIEFGSNPTATTSKMPIKAGVPEYFGVNPAEKVAAITAA